jgi:hypothetical protein
VVDSVESHGGGLVMPRQALDVLDDVEAPAALVGAGSLNLLFCRAKNGDGHS